MVEAISPVKKKDKIHPILIPIVHPIESPSTKPKNPQTINTLAKAKPKGIFALSKPQIKTPSALFEVIKAHEMVTKSHRESAILQKDELQDDLDELAKLEKKMLEELKLRCKEESKEQYWSFLGRVATFAGSAASFVLGMKLISSGAGAPLGYFLIASGGLGVAGEVLKDNGWEIFASYFTKDIETQKKAASYMENAMFLLSLGLGLYGIHALYGKELLTLAKLNSTKDIAAKITLIASGTKFLTQSMKTYASYKIANHDAFLSIASGEKSFLENSIKEISNEVKQSFETTNNINEAMKKIINNQPIIN